MFTDGKGCSSYVTTVEDLDDYNYMQHVNILIFLGCIIHNVMYLQHWFDLLLQHMFRRITLIQWMIGLFRKPKAQWIRLGHWKRRDYQSTRFTIRSRYVCMCDWQCVPYTKLWYSSRLKPVFHQFTSWLPTIGICCNQVVSHLAVAIMIIGSGCQLQWLKSWQCFDQHTLYSSGQRLKVIVETGWSDQSWPPSVFTL